MNYRHTTSTNRRARRYSAMELKRRDEMVMGLAMIFAVVAVSIGVLWLATEDAKDQRAAARQDRETASYVLVGYGCEGTDTPILRAEEDLFPEGGCERIERTRLF